MATKSKSIPYSWPVKLISVILIGVSTIILFVMFYQLASGATYLFKDNYYETERFLRNYARLANNAVEKEIHFIEADTYGLSEAQEQEWQTRLATIDGNLSQGESFAYMLVDSETNQVLASNRQGLSVAWFEEQPSLVKWDRYDMRVPGDSDMSAITELTSVNSLSYYNNARDVIQWLDGTEYVLYTAVDEVISPWDSFFYDTYEAYHQFKLEETRYLSWFIGSFLLALLCFIHLSYTVGRKGKEEAPGLIWYDRVPFEIQVLFLVFTSLPSIYLFQRGTYYDADIYWLGGALFFFSEVTLLTYLSQVRRIRSGAFAHGFIVYRLVSGLVKALSLSQIRRTFKPWMLLVLLVYVGGNMALTLTMWWAIDEGVIFLILLLVFCGYNLAALKYFLKELRSLQTIMDTAKAHAGGNLGYELNTAELSHSFYDLGTNIKTMQDGMTKALDQAMKGERMKTELITNVTHDLKNPLTSIITYVELLKQAQVSQEERLEYTEVLSEKSHRLKSLVDQLVEASKASSGNINPETHDINVCEMVQQVLGEFEEAYDHKGLQLLTQMPEDCITLKTDGRLVYRILENLLSNVSKYALEGTRVYLSVESRDLDAQVVLRNISREPLNMSSSDLMERFTRGDSSRNTEGNGLGLSIALSLAEVLGGHLDITVDGDLFKASLSLPR